jgi:hypothetical protein
MTGDDAPSLTALLCEFGGLWAITRTSHGFTAQRRPQPAPPVVLAAPTVPALRELLEHGYDTGKLAELMRDYGTQWDIERLDPGSTWVAVSHDSAQTRVITAGDLDSLRSKLSSSKGEASGDDSSG